MRIPEYFEYKVFIHLFTIHHFCLYTEPLGERDTPHPPLTSAAAAAAAAAAAVVVVVAAG